MDVRRWLMRLRPAWPTARQPGQQRSTSWDRRSSSCGRRFGCSTPAAAAAPPTSAWKWWSRQRCAIFEERFVIVLGAAKHLATLDQSLFAATFACPPQLCTVRATAWRARACHARARMSSTQRAATCTAERSHIWCEQKHERERTGAPGRRARGRMGAAPYPGAWQASQASRTARGPPTLHQTRARRPATLPQRPRAPAPRRACLRRRGTAPAPPRRRRRRRHRRRSRLTRRSTAWRRQQRHDAAQTAAGSRLWHPGRARRALPQSRQTCRGRDGVRGVRASRLPPVPSHDPVKSNKCLLNVRGQ